MKTIFLSTRHKSLLGDNRKIQQIERAENDAMFKNCNRRHLLLFFDNN